MSNRINQQELKSLKEGKNKKFTAMNIKKEELKMGFD